MDESQIIADIAILKEKVRRLEAEIFPESRTQMGVVLDRMRTSVQQMEAERKEDAPVRFIVKIIRWFKS